jgi:hypothetical protein
LTPTERHIREQFVEDGFTCVRGLLDPSEAAFYIARLRARAGTADRWTEPDGLSRHPEFWPLIFNERLLAAVREILGPSVRYLPHTDLHVGFSSFSWHRDNVNRNFGNGADWDEENVPYSITRVGIYLQRYSESGFRIGFVKGSHRTGQLSGAEHRRLGRATSAAAVVFSWLSGRDSVASLADWVAPDAGDCLIFDPRVLHTGSRFHGQKYSIFLAYGVENAHFRNHWHYYSKLRTDLGYSKLPPLLSNRLKAAGLLACEPPDNLAVERAWIPSTRFVSVAKRFK